MKTSDVIEQFGSKIRLAEKLGISPSAVTQWGEIVPESRRYQIQVLTRGKLKAVPVNSKPDRVLGK
ncbi:Cro/CI family transcriptional regulator [Pseudomonas sp. B26(2017)]|uniref:Cro/CI family transcriptional regulator n=1 Tax=Pseudomonas sp. B26(2017) TaxID=1981732 RepID=UPI000A1E27E5|nr:Cro/CI family transcriptional regulator [Pseudomonas sp. B26(2017)]